MDWAVRTNSRSRLRLAMVAAVVLAALTATAAVTAPNPVGAQTAEVTLLGAVTSTNTQPRSPFPAFVLDRGRYTAFEAPEQGVDLFPVGINNRGVIAGEYIRAASESGFIRDERGRFTILDIPGAKGTEAAGINNRGQIVGQYSQDTPIVNDSAKVRAYLWDRGKVTRIDAPGATVTNALGINDHAQVVGAYRTSTGEAHGYLWERGRLRTIDVRGAVITQPFDINNRGQVVGYYFDTAGAIHGYLWDRGHVVIIDAPDAPITLPFGINDRGQIVGQLRTDATVPPAEDPGTRGFLLAKGVNGPFTPVNFPGAPKSIANGINDRGQIVGLYQNPHATPSPQRNAEPSMDMLAGPPR